MLIDCWAEWCGACQTFDPVFKKVAEKYPDHVFAKLDATTEKELISSLEIENIPALVLFKEGIMLFKQPGYYQEEKLEDIISQAEKIDMNEVRAHIAAQNG